MISMWNNLHAVIIETYKIKLYKDKYNKQKKVTDIYILRIYPKWFLDIVSSKKK